MNCLEFRRACLTEPAGRGEEFVAHRNGCPDCARFAEEVGVLDDKLLDVMRVPVPDDLQTRIRLRQVISEEQSRRLTRPWQLALAASVFLSVALSGLFGYQLYSTNRYIDQLRVAVIEHVKEEPQFLVAEEEGSGERFGQVLAAFGGEVVQDIAPVRVAEVCALRKKNQPIAHTVVNGKMGPVTILYVQGDPVRKTMPIDDGRFSGMLVPAGQGNLAVIGTPDEPLQPLVDKLQQGIVWRI